MVRGMKSSNLLLQIVKQRAVEKRAHTDIETVTQLSIPREIAHLNRSN